MENGIQAILRSMSVLMAQIDEEQGMSLIQGKTDDQRSSDIGPRRPLLSAEEGGC